MAVIRCDKGHYFDNGKYTQCPFCGILIEDEVTMALPKGPPGQWERDDDSKTVAMESGFQVSMAEDDDQTISLFMERQKGDPVTGWLVCVSGYEVGRDFRLHQGFNRIGRSYEWDVPLMEDPAVRKAAECAVVYDDKSNCFYAVQQMGGMAYLNGKLLDSSCILNSGDIIKVGESELEFIAFCREGRVWESE